MGLSDLVSPISSPNRNDVHLGIKDSSLNSTLNFLMDFTSKSNMSLTISDNNIDLETCSLSSSGLFLDRFHLHDFFFENVFQEESNDFRFLDRDRESEDLF
jgi:hypothetical protein